MKRKQKGFTLVELLVVIAILAVLATVSILGYSSFTKKANISNDQSIVSQMNLTLQSNEALGEGAKYEHQAIKQCIEAGFILENLTPSTNGYHYAYDQANNRFMLLTENYEFNYGDKVYSDPKTNPEKIFVVVKNQTEINAAKNDKGSFSVYLKEEYSDATAEVKAGIDTGNADITTITLTSDYSSALYVHTNSEAITLNVDAPNTTIYHYEVIGIVNIIRTADSSYHEFGTSNFVQNASGRVVAEEGGTIVTCVLTAKGATASLSAFAQENGGNIENCYATTNEVAATNNAESKNVQLIVESVSNNGDVLGEGKTAEQITAIIESKKDEVSALANNSNHASIEGVVRIGSKGYATFDAALSAIEDGQVIVFTKDIEKNDVFIFEKNITATIDLAGHTLKVTGSASSNGGRAIKITKGNVTVKNGTIDGRSYNGENLNPNSSSSSPWSNTRIGGCIRVNGANVTLLNLKMYNNDGWGNAVKLESNNTLTIRNCTIESVYGACIEVGYGTANIYDCQFRQSFTPKNSYIVNCVAVCYLGTANIYDTTMIKDEEGELVNGSSESNGVCPLFVYDSGGVINVNGGYFETSLKNVLEIDATNIKYRTGTVGTGECKYTADTYNAFVQKNGGSAVINVTNAKLVGNVKVNGAINGTNTETTKLNVYSGSFSADVSKYKK